MHSPAPIGPLSSAVIRLIRDPRNGHGLLDPLLGDSVVDDDFQLALWCCYELHYRGFEDVADETEWDLRVLGLRRHLERRFEADLRRAVDSAVPDAPELVPALLGKLVANDKGPSLSTYLQRNATYEQFREFVMHRSVYHLKEADPHSWGIPRLSGRPKAALVEIQADEYGGGSPTRMHSELFQTMMRGFGLDAGYGRYVDRANGITLASTNVISLFGLHRRLRGALAGHLAMFEMTSSIPNARYARGVRRLGGTDETADFFDEHVKADAVHEQIAAYDLCGSLALDEPQLAPDIMFGAAAARHLDDLFAEHLLASWSAGSSSLR